MSNSRDRIADYLQAIRRNMRWEITARGLGWTFVAVLVLTCLAVFLAHNARFSDSAVRWTRLLLFGGTGAALAWVLIRPLLKQRSDAQIARFVEDRRPEFRDRLSTAVECQEHKSDPIASAIQDLLLEDTARQAEQAP